MSSYLAAVFINLYVKIIFGGAYRDRTGVSAFAELCLNHSAKAPFV